MVLCKGGVDDAADIPAKKEAKKKSTWLQTEDEHLKW